MEQGNVFFFFLREGMIVLFSSFFSFVFTFTIIVYPNEFSSRRAVARPVAYSSRFLRSVVPQCICERSTRGGCVDVWIVRACAREACRIFSYAKKI